MYAMQADLSHCENVAELEDDILCFLPTVSDLDVFGFELELLNLQTQQLLPEAFRTVLLQRPQLQILVRPCMVDGHSIWQFQNDGKKSYSKAVRVPAQPVGGSCRQSILCCTFASACRSDNWHSTCRSCGLAGVSATTNCQAPTLSHKSGRRSFPKVLCAARGHRPRMHPMRSKGVCRVLLLQSSWGQSWNRRQQCPCTRGTTR